MPQPRIIVQDGKRYTFTPGENGSLIAQPLNGPAPQPLFLDPQQRPPVSRVIGPAPAQDPLAQLRLLLARR